MVYLFASSLFLVACFSSAAVGELCSPSQWEGYEGSTGGYSYHGHAGIIQEWMKVSYDAENQRKAAFIHYVNNDYENRFQMVERYGDDGDDNSGRVYVLNLKTDKCWSKKLEKPFTKACVPDDAKPFGDHYMGLKGKGGFLVSMYVVNKKDVTCVLSVSKQGNDVMIPIGETLYGKVMGSSFIQPMGFLDITPGIANKTVFDIPPQCKEMDDMSVTEYLMREHSIFGF